MTQKTSNVANRVTPRNGNDTVIQCGPNKAKGTKDATEYLFAQLRAGTPVMIEVDYQPGTGPSNVNDMDHYLVVTGSGVDKQGRQYPTFNDPQQPNAGLGTAENPVNRLYRVGDEFMELGAAKGHTPYQLFGVMRNLSFNAGYTNARGDSRCEL